ncbi:hypothetical protein [Cryptosporangium aurantiacum]|uniref:Uncharacterized protein n=1 Tax=Cryptosporangium aurantiacum TaxID=134849 RepID=A0A1M7MII4_9ACTN|nr:hypothetical protein [Cryptosporangium aurantiacum]SHM90676.1 hypothetical protein SAMN05443668_102137 [Cryptosporangium aurantiacum]
MTVNPSDADRSTDLDSDPHHDALATTYDEVDTRSPAEIAEDREEADATPDPHTDHRPTIPAVPKPVVPAVAGVLTFVLLAFPFGWTILGAVIGALVAAAISYAFVFRL